MSKGLTIGELYKLTKGKKRQQPRFPLYLPLSHEVNYVDANGGGACNSTGLVTHINVIAVNATVNGRTGKMVRMKSIQVKLMVTAGTTGTVATAMHMLILDRKPSGALPLVTDIVNAASPYNFLNDVGSTRFKVLRRWVHSLCGNSTTPAAGSERAFTEDYLMIPYDAVYDIANTSGVIAQMRENALYILATSDVAAGTAAPNSVCATRVRFYPT